MAESEPSAFPGQFMHAAEAELERRMMRQVFAFDQGAPALTEHVDAITTVAARHRASGAQDIDVLARTHNAIRDDWGHMSTEALRTLLAAFAVALADERARTEPA